MSNIKTGWELFGKLSAILAVIATTITIWNYVFPNAEDIEVTGRFETYALPPNLISMLENIKEHHDYRKIRDFFLKEKIPKVKLNEDQINELSQALDSFLNSTWDKEFNYDYHKYNGFSILEVTNTGNKTAEKIVLDLPAKGVAIITYNDDSQAVIKFNKKIEIKNMRPSNKTHVVIWAEQKLGRYDEDSFSLSHANGVGEFSFGKTVYGFSRFFDEQGWLFIWIFGMLVPFVVITLWNTSSSKKTTVAVTKNDDSESSEKESNNAPIKNTQ